MLLYKRCFFLLTSSLVLMLASCGNGGEALPTQSDEETASAPLFTLLSPEKTNIRFNNAITENQYANIFTYQYFYNGGGVAIADVNRDGLQDIYFSGNQVENKLYLNRGGMKFEDVTAFSGVAGASNSWKTGVAIADVNGDSLPDIYQCYSGPLQGMSRKNQLLINEGVDKNGIPVYRDQAAAYGLDDSAFTTQGAFFDYDRDGDLDLFMLNHNPAPFRTLDEISIQEIRKKREPSMHAKLYQNNGSKFTDVSEKAGLQNSAFSYGLGVGVSDINTDGWPDVYVANDYSAPDFLLINNKNGTFTDKLGSSIQHTSLYSMGTDIGDINNDGLPDIITLDMLPEDNKRQKLLFGPDNYEYFNLIVQAGFHHQYMRNMLQVANGDGTFSEIGQLIGISNTDWSCAPLIADYDNDGLKDLFVTNGFLKDFTNMDFIKFRSDYFKYLDGKITPGSLTEVMAKMPASNVTNYLFQNRGDLQFQNKSRDWGMKEPSNSNGAAYADLDNDGDLDLVANNINQVAFIYQNGAEKAVQHHYLQLKFSGSGKNTDGLGAKVFLYQNGQQQYAEQMTCRGYQSTVSPVMQFGLGKTSTIDSLKIIWPGGKQQLLQNIKADQLLTVEEKAATDAVPPSVKVVPLFTETAASFSFTHLASPINDFKRQPLLVNPQSFAGPCMIKGDVNGDGLDDVFVGGAAGQAGTFYVQQKGGGFAQKANAAFEADKASEDVDAVLFDANGDKLPDLYVASGGYHNFLPQDTALQDRLYLNDGKGTFSKAVTALPKMLTSSGCVRVHDINGDGALDLFVGGRVVPGRYPETPESYVLINNGKGIFRDATKETAPALQRIGMVSDAAWHDLDGDNRKELVVVGEWMPLAVFSNRGGKLVDNTTAFFAKKYSGWWNKLLIGDFNNDRYPDMIVGNQGLNTQCKASDKKPAELYFKDFDENGAVDPILCFYMGNKSYPYVTRDELLDQVSMMRTRFQDYSSYAEAGYEQIFTEEERKGAGRFTANHLQTTLFLGTDKGVLKEAPLPIAAQFSPIFAIAALDYNKDGAVDLILGGNITQARLRFGKYDAVHGLLLKGDGKGGFTSLSQRESGFRLLGDVRSILQLDNQLFFGMNQAPVRAYKMQQ